MYSSALPSPQRLPSEGSLLASLQRAAHRASSTAVSLSIARQFAANAVRANPCAAESYESLAGVEAQLGNTEAACVCYRLALGCPRLKPSFEKEIRERAATALPGVETDKAAVLTPLVVLPLPQVAAVKRRWPPVLSTWLELCGEAPSGSLTSMIPRALLGPVFSARGRGMSNKPKRAVVSPSSTAMTSMPVVNSTAPLADVARGRRYWWETSRVCCSQGHSMLLVRCKPYFGFNMWSCDACSFGIHANDAERDGVYHCLEPCNTDICAKCVRSWVHPVRTLKVQPTATATLKALVSAVSRRIRHALGRDSGDEALDVRVAFVTSTPSIGFSVATPKVPMFGAYHVSAKRWMVTLLPAGLRDVDPQLTTPPISSLARRPDSTPLSAFTSQSDAYDAAKLLAAICSPYERRSPSANDDRVSPALLCYALPSGHDVRIVGHRPVELTVTQLLELVHGDIPYHCGLHEEDARAVVYHALVALNELHQRGVAVGCISPETTIVALRPSGTARFVEVVGVTFVPLLGLLTSAKKMSEQDGGDSGGMRVDEAKYEATGLPSLVLAKSGSALQYAAPELLPHRALAGAVLHTEAKSSSRHDCPTTPMGAASDAGCRPDGDASAVVLTSAQRADIWALGCLWATLLTGVWPHLDHTLVKSKSMMASAATTTTTTTALPDADSDNDDLPDVEDLVTACVKMYKSGNAPFNMERLANVVSGACLGLVHSMLKHTPHLRATTTAILRDSYFTAMASLRRPIRPTVIFLQTLGDSGEDVNVAGMEPFWAYRCRAGATLGALGGSSLGALRNVILSRRDAVYLIEIHAFREPLRDDLPPVDLTGCWLYLARSFGHRDEEVGVALPPSSSFVRAEAFCGRVVSTAPSEGSFSSSSGTLFVDRVACLRYAFGRTEEILDRRRLPHPFDDEAQEADTQMSRPDSGSVAIEMQSPSEKPASIHPMLRQASSQFGQSGMWTPFDADARQREITTVVTTPDVGCLIVDCAAACRRDAVDLLIGASHPHGAVAHSETTDDGAGHDANASSLQRVSFSVVDLELEDVQWREKGMLRCTLRLSSPPLHSQELWSLRRLIGSIPLMQSASVKRKVAARLFLSLVEYHNDGRSNMMVARAKENNDHASSMLVLSTQYTLDSVFAVLTTTTATKDSSASTAILLGTHGEATLVGLALAPAACCVLPPLPSATQATSPTIATTMANSPGNSVPTTSMRQKPHDAVHFICKLAAAFLFGLSVTDEFVVTPPRTSKLSKFEQLLLSGVDGAFGSTQDLVQHPAFAAARRELASDASYDDATTNTITVVVTADMVDAGRYCSSTTGDLRLWAAAWVSPTAERAASRLNKRDEDTLEASESCARLALVESVSPSAIRLQPDNSQTAGAPREDESLLKWLLRGDSATIDKVVFVEGYADILFLAGLLERDDMGDMSNYRHKTAPADDIRYICPVEGSSSQHHGASKAIPTTTASAAHLRFFMESSETNPSHLTVTMERYGGISPAGKRFIFLRDNDLKLVNPTLSQRGEFEFNPSHQRWFYYHRLRFGRAVENYLLPPTMPLSVLFDDPFKAFLLTLEVFATMARLYFPVFVGNRESGGVFPGRPGDGWIHWPETAADTSAPAMRAMDFAKKAAKRCLPTWPDVEATQLLLECFRAGDQRGTPEVVARLLELMAAIVASNASSDGFFPYAHHNLIDAITLSNLLSGKLDISSIVATLPPVCVDTKADARKPAAALLRIREGDSGPFLWPHLRLLANYCSSVLHADATARESLSAGTTSASKRGKPSAERDGTVPSSFRFFAHRFLQLFHRALWFVHLGDVLEGAADAIPLLLRPGEAHGGDDATTTAAATAALLTTTVPRCHGLLPPLTVSTSPRDVLAWWPITPISPDGECRQGEGDSSRADRLKAARCLSCGIRIAEHDSFFRSSPSATFLAPPLVAAEAAAAPDGAVAAAPASSAPPPSPAPLLAAYVVAASYGWDSHPMMEWLHGGEKCLAQRFDTAQLDALFATVSEAWQREEWDDMTQEEFAAALLSDRPQPPRNAREAAMFEAVDRQALRLREEIHHRHFDMSLHPVVVASDKMPHDSGATGASQPSVACVHCAAACPQYQGACERMCAAARAVAPTVERLVRARKEELRAIAAKVRSACRLTTTAVGAPADTSASKKAQKVKTKVGSA